MVRLALSVSVTPFTATAGFNPTLVRLALSSKFLAVQLALGFNPTLVRLARWIVEVGSTKDETFQSHVGSISTTGWYCRRTLSFLFQSHVGSISTLHRTAELSALCPSFNPTLVRLAPCQSSAFAAARSRFQSHVGSISTLTLSRRLPTRRQFQSHVGSISTSVSGYVYCKA